MIGTSAPLLASPSLTHVLSNFTRWPKLDQPITHDPQATNPTDSRNAATSFMDAHGHVSSAITQRDRKRRGRPPASTTTSKNRPMQGHRKGKRKTGRRRGRPPRKAPIPIQQTASSTSDSDVSDPSAHVTTDQGPSAPPNNLRYGLRRDRAPRFCCGTCGLRDCTFNLLIDGDDPIRPRGILAINETIKSLMVNRLVIRNENTYSGVERSQSLSIELIMTKLNESESTKAHCPRFKEWTHDHYGLEFTLPVTIPPALSNIAIGPFNYE